MSGTASLRLFVAIPVPAEVKSALQQAQQELRAVMPAGRASWTRPESMHLTLRFLGNVAEQRVIDLQDRLRSALAGFGRPDLICERLGCFPDLRCPRVIWAWVHDAEEQLAAIATRINEVVASDAEKPADTRFVGHITLARPRRFRGPEAEKLARFAEGAVNRGFGVWKAGRIELIQSVLSPAGSRYATLATFDLEEKTPP